jgi:hypothetical protein
MTRRGSLGFPSQSCANTKCKQIRDDDGSTEATLGSCTSRADRRLLVSRRINCDGTICNAVFCIRCSHLLTRTTALLADHDERAEAIHLANLPVKVSYSGWNLSTGRYGERSGKRACRWRKALSSVGSPTDISSFVK